MKKDINNFKITKNFNLKEFSSPDTGEVKINSKLVFILQHLRNIVGKPIIVNSGYRTVKHNKKVKGKNNSSHLRGNAADIWCRERSIYQLFCCVLNVCIHRIIAYDHKKFLHLDLDGYKYIEIPKYWGYTRKRIPKKYKLKLK